MEKTYLEKAQEFLVNQMDVERLFSFLDRGDYIILFQLRKVQKDDRIYLKDIAETLKRPMHEVSQMISNLQDKGYVIWKTDEMKNKTYVVLSEQGKALLVKQRDRIETCYKKILESVTPEALATTIATLHTVREILIAEQ